MPPTPLYTSQSIERPAYQLRYTWTGWPSTGQSFHSAPPENVVAELKELWEQDGIRVLESAWQPDRIQVTCSVTPTVSPVLFTSRIKGRLQYALRKNSYDTSFSRKVAFRSIGETTRKQVEDYIAKQVSKEQFVDDRFATMVAQFTVHYPKNRLDEAIPTKSGRYWYNLHVVIVTDSRTRFTDEASLSKLSRLCDAIAIKKAHRVSTRSVMPDHIHMALGGCIDQSPEDIALAYMNNTAHALGQNRLWQAGYYVGTFSEYDMGAVRNG